MVFDLEIAIAAGSTLVFVSHDAALERLFDRTVNLATISRQAAGAVQAAAAGG